MYENITAVYSRAVNDGGPISALYFPSSSSAAISSSVYTSNPAETGVGASRMINFNPNACTIDFWFKLGAGYTNTTGPISLSQTAGTGTPATPYFTFGPVNSSGVKIDFNINGTSAVAANQPSGTPLTFNKSSGGIASSWYHCQFIITETTISSTSATRIQCFIDGDLASPASLVIAARATWTAATIKTIKMNSASELWISNFRIRDTTTVPITPFTLESDPSPNTGTVCLIKGHVTPNTPIVNELSNVLISSDNKQLVDINGANGATISGVRSWRGWYPFSRNTSTITINQQASTTLNCTVVVGSPTDPTSLGDVFTRYSSGSTQTFNFPKLNKYTSNITLPINIIQNSTNGFGRMTINPGSEIISRINMRSCALPRRFKILKSGQTLLLDTSTNQYTYTPSSFTREGIFYSTNASDGTSVKTPLNLTGDPANIVDYNSPSSNIMSTILQDWYTLRTCAIVSSKLTLLAAAGKVTQENTHMYARVNGTSYDILNRTNLITDLTGINFITLS